MGIGGSLRDGSRSEQILRIALEAAQEEGANISALTGSDLVLPFYDPMTRGSRPAKATKLVEALRAADGIIVVSPGYHGALSGLVKNALDYAEDLRHDVRPYFDGRAVGTIAVADGWQAAVTTLEQVRTITHSLRGWPTPLGGVVNTADAGLGAQGLDDKTRENLRTVGRQVAQFARCFHRV